MPHAHAFAAYVRILGRGKTLTRALTLEEAEAAMTMILRREAAPEALGAFLMLMRVKEETGAEIAGFIRAARAAIAAPAIAVDLEWPSYAGKKRQAPWGLITALALARSGRKVFMHGLDGHTEGRLYAGEALARLGVAPARNFNEVETHLSDANFAYLSLDAMNAELARLMRLKPVLGLRSPIHTVARGLNPLKAPASMQAVFHPGYVAIHRDASLKLADGRTLIFRGDGGENERRPSKTCETTLVAAGAVEEKRWPAELDARAAGDENPDVARLVEVWRGARDEYGEAAIVGTLALALYALGEAEPEAGARRIWEERDRLAVPQAKATGNELCRSSSPARGEAAAAGEVYLVGAGPGDPDLLTLRALKLIRQAEVALFDNLVAPAILEKLPSSVERVYVGKRPGEHAAPQAEISARLAALAREGKRVLRLKGGDPFLFGRGGEEIETLAAEGVRFEVCPGVTAALGAAAYAGIPLTHRDFAQSCAFVAGMGKEGRIPHDWKALVHPGQTVAIYMGLGEIEAIAADMLAQGVDANTPAAIVDNGARLNQRVVVADVAGLAAAARAAALKGPTIIIVGAVVTLRKKLDWRWGEA